MVFCEFLSGTGSVARRTTLSGPDAPHELPPVARASKVAKGSDAEHLVIRGKISEREQQVHPFVALRYFQHCLDIYSSWYMLPRQRV